MKVLKKSAREEISGGAVNRPQPVLVEELFTDIL